MAYSVYFSGKVPKPQSKKHPREQNRNPPSERIALYSVLSTITKHRSKYHGLLRILLRYSVENTERAEATLLCTL